jgi:hypothetical protein
MDPLDAWLPEWDVRERHERTTSRPAEDALARLLATPVADDAVVGALYRLRGLGARGTIVDSFARMGFDVLERTQTSFVVGASGAPWRFRQRLGPFADETPGRVRIVADVRASGRTLSTETRVAATDAAARRRFRLYWLAIAPFSKLIRRRWLAAAA